MTTEVTDQNETRLPRAVRAQLERMNERHETKPAGEPPDTTVTDPAASAGDLQPAADPRESDPAYWKQRFQVTQGMLKSFQDRQGEAHAARDRELAELREKVRSLESERKTSASELDLQAFFTPQQIEQFGEEQCKAMAYAATKAARDQAQAMIDAEVKPIQERSKADAQRVDDAKESAFWEQLAEIVPDFEQIDTSADWLEWLAEPDDATGLVRQDILDRHRSARNARGVAKVFDGFKASRAKPAPLVAPPRSVGAGAPPAPAAPAKGYPTRDEIRDFYRRSAMRKVGEKERVEFEERLRSRAAA